MPPDNPLETPARVRQYWPTLLEDVEATVEEYEENGYDGVVLRTGSVTVREPDADGGAPALSVLLPNNEFDKLESKVDELTVSAADVYLGTTDDLVLLGICLRFESESLVVGFPAYYNRRTDTEAIESAQEHGELVLRFRTLDGTELLLPCTDPEQFLSQDE